jgi:hypothetical protein
MGHVIESDSQPQCNHAHFVVVPRQERSLARMFGEAHCNFPRRLAGNLWQEFFHSYPMDERKGLGSTHEKFVKVSVSPSTIFCQIRLTRRSVQSQADSGLLH